MNIDEAYADFQSKEAAHKTALEQCEAEQAAGRTGLDQYRRAKALNEELTALGATLVVNLDQALASL